MSSGRVNEGTSRVLLSQKLGTIYEAFFTALVNIKQTRAKLHELLEDERIYVSRYIHKLSF